tara:strand:+ start:163 stop:324 length:162 start_codon:yes stop_codon:yes gene_type:complete
VFIVRKIQDKYPLPPTPGEFQAGATLPISGDFEFWIFGRSYMSETMPTRSGFT